MGELFRSFEDSWRFFLERTEPMESFFELFPERDATFCGWLIPLADQLKPRVAEVQHPLRNVSWMRLLPAHFLHVSVSGFGVGGTPNAKAVDAMVEKATVAWRAPRAVRASLPAPELLSRGGRRRGGG